MIKKIEDLNFYELLEVRPGASVQEIHRAYERVRKIYEPNSIALYSLFTPEETASIHQRIEEAYRTLIYEDNRKKYDALLRSRNELPEEPPAPARYSVPPRPVQQVPARPPATPPPVAAEPAPPPEPVPQQERASMAQFIGEFTGPAIKALREQIGYTVRAVADLTKVSTRYIDLMEAESFDKLPARTYTRGFLMLYAKALGCDPEKMASDFLKRYDAVMKPPKPK
jgi:curved DNA-binding protein CbpA